MLRVLRVTSPGLCFQARIYLCVPSSQHGPAERRAEMGSAWWAPGVGYIVSPCLSFLIPENDITSCASLQASPGSYEGPWEGSVPHTEVSESRHYCLASFLTFPTWAHSVSFCRIPISLTLALPGGPDHGGCSHRAGSIQGLLLGRLGVGGAAGVQLTRLGTDTPPAPFLPPEMGTLLSGSSLAWGAWAEEGPSCP